MKERKIISLIKRGWSDQMIRQEFINCKNFSLFKCREIGAKDQPEEFLTEIRGLGFAEVSKQESEEEFVTGYFKKSMLWVFQKEGFRIEFTWIEHLKSDERDYEIELALPSDLKVRLWISDEPLSSQIARIIEVWPNIQRELEDLDLQIRRLRDGMADETEKIDEWISVLLKERNWEHSILRNSGETLLRIRMAHSRYFEIKLQKSKDLPSPAALAKKIEKAKEALESIGDVNLSVKKYVRESIWK